MKRYRSRNSTEKHLSALAYLSKIASLPFIHVLVYHRFVIDISCFLSHNHKFLSRAAGFPPLSPLRTVHATFTAHGSRNPKLIFVLINRLCATLGTAFERARLTVHCPPFREVLVVGRVEGVGFRPYLRVTEQWCVGESDEG